MKKQEGATLVNSNNDFSFLEKFFVVLQDQLEVLGDMTVDVIEPVISRGWVVPGQSSKTNSLHMQILSQVGKLCPNQGLTEVSTKS